MSAGRIQPKKDESRTGNRLLNELGIIEEFPTLSNDATDYLYRNGFMDRIPKSVLRTVKNRRFLRALRSAILGYALTSATFILVLYPLFMWSMGDVEGRPYYVGLNEKYREYIQTNGDVPKTMREFAPPKRVLSYTVNPYPNVVLATAPEYAKWTDRYPDMLFIDKRPRRTIFPFPFGVWMNYGIPYAPDLHKKEWDEGTVYRRINCDWHARTLAAAISAQEGGDYNLARSFIPDAIMYAALIALIVLYCRRQRKKARQEETTFQRVRRFRDDALAYRAKTGRFPVDLNEFGADDASQYRDAVRRREFRYLAPYDFGVVAATRPWRAPFALWGFGCKSYAIYEDGSIVMLRGFAARYFDDLAVALSKSKALEKFRLSKEDLDFRIVKRRALTVRFFMGTIALLIISPVVALATFQFGVLIKSMFGVMRPIGPFDLSLPVLIWLFYAAVIFWLLGGALVPHDFYVFLAHRIYGVI